MTSVRATLRCSRVPIGWLGALVGLALCLAAPAAAGAPAGEHGAPLAESLFRDAKQLAASGDYAEACPKFAESHRIDPQLGTLLHLATCHEQQGKTASAWAEFGEAAEWAARVGDRRRESLARDRIATLEPRLGHLMVEVDEDREGMRITLDGQPLGVASLATPLPVDPGQHLLEVSAPGAKPWSLRVHVPKDQEVVAVRIPRLELLATAEPPPSTPDEGGAQRAAGWVLGGVGLAAAVVTAVFGVRASGQADDADGFCEGRYCTAAGLELHDEAHTSADVATGAFVVALACLGTGITLLATAPSSDGEPSESTARAGLRVVASPSAARLIGGLRW